MSKKSNSPLLWVGITVAVLWGFNTLVSAFNNRIQFGTIKMKFRGVTTSFGLLLDVVMPIQNLNPITISLEDFRGEIWYGPVRIVTVDQRNPVTLAANSTTNYQMEAEIDTGKLAADIKAQILSKNFLQAFFLKGTMRVGSINVPVNEQITVLF